MRRLVLLRPEPGASRSAERAEALGIEVAKLPLFDVRPVAWRAPDARDYDLILITSANAVRLGGEELAKLVTLPVAAVGRATADAARSAGFRVDHVGGDNATSLIASLPPSRMLHLAGRDHVDSGGETMIVYEARPCEAPSDLALIDDAVVAIHSTRAGARLAEVVGGAGVDRSTVSLVAISAVAAAAAGQGWREVRVASRPDDDALLACAAELCLETGE